MSVPPEAMQSELVEIDAVDTTVTDTEDGGAIIALGEEMEDAAASAHWANLAEELPYSELTAIATDLLEKVDRDKEAREKRDKLYEEGIRRTGLGDDAPGGAQFSGATRVVHPMLVEACVDFSARVMKEIFPPNGPVKSKLYGPQDQDKLEKAQRKAEFMNWQCTQQIKELRSDLEQLSTQLPLSGVQYLKLTWDNKLRRSRSEFVPVDDVYLPYAATNFYTAERRTHVQYITAQGYRKRVLSGMYLDVELPSPEEPEPSKAQKASDRIEGREATTYNEDGLRTIYEICTELDVEGFDAPYIVSIDRSTHRVLSVYRNWEEMDETRTELVWMVEFPFVPWRGAYPIGLTHMIGGLSAAATGALRALLDSAHLNNFPSAVKLKGGGPGQNINLQVSQITELEGGGMVDDIRKLIMGLPFNPPSPVLFQLLGFLGDAGKGVIQTSFEKLADGNPNAPVGTTLALIEQGMVVFSSIHSRLHHAMGVVFSVLHRLNSAYLTDAALEAYDCGIEVSPDDFDGPADVVPVSDPAIFSETQRFAQMQAVQQRAAQVPDLYDARKVETMFLRSLKLSPDDVLKPQIGEDDVDPVSENVAAIMGQPIYVLVGQDHIAHMKVHMAFYGSPLFGQNPAMQKQAAVPFLNHVRDHVLNYYLTQCHASIKKAEEMGVALPEALNEADLILTVQQAVEGQLKGLDQQLGQMTQAAEQLTQPPPGQQDPSLAVAQLNVQARQQDAQLRAQVDQQRLAQAGQATQARMQLDAAKLQQQKELEMAKLRVQQLEQQQEAQRQAEEATQRMMLEQTKQQAEDRRKAEELAARERMNQADNETAMRLAAAEIISGEKVAVSTGTGINPGV